MADTYVGKVCINSVGRVGVVTNKCDPATGEGWQGFGLDGKGCWSTRSETPFVVCESLNDYRILVASKGGTGGHLYK